MTYQEFVSGPTAQQRYWGRSHLGWGRMKHAEPERRPPRAGPDRPRAADHPERRRAARARRVAPGGGPARPDRRLLPTPGRTGPVRRPWAVAEAPVRRGRRRGCRRRRRRRCGGRPGGWNWSWVGSPWGLVGWWTVAIVGRPGLRRRRGWRRSTPASRHRVRRRRAHRPPVLLRASAGACRRRVAGWRGRRRATRATPLNSGVIQYTPPEKASCRPFTPNAKRVDGERSSPTRWAAS